MENSFKSIKQSCLSKDTIKTYLDLMQDAFILEKSIRYDIKGKKYIDTPSKYYFTDLGLRNARLNFRQTEFTHLLEPTPTYQNEAGITIMNIYDFLMNPNSLGI